MILRSEPAENRQSTFMYILVRPMSTYGGDSWFCNDKKIYVSIDTELTSTYVYDD